VILPKWAEHAEDYLLKMRAGFESDYVSAHINEWIDLIFGYKQTGTTAITADNVYYYLTYQDNVNFDRAMPKMERTALEVQISEFGQCPIQLFDERHPTKRTRIINLDLTQGTEDRRMVSAKMVALV
jgi:factor associated with neutral sphingomyelinase activation